MIGKVNTSLSLEEIRNTIGEANIAAHFLGVAKIPCRIKSPLRQDNKPSFGIYSRDGKSIYYIDFATQERGSLFDLLCKMWKCDLPTCLTIISTQVCVSKSQKVNKTAVSRIKIDKCNQSKMLCKVRQWQKHDIDYWKSYGISLKFLKMAEVFPISHKIIIKNGKQYVFGADKYAYAYAEHKEGKTTLKIYQPFNTKGFKWSNKHDSSVISLWTKVPETGDIIIICSSLKDALCLWETTGIPTIATQGEGYSMSKTAIEQLKKRYKHIYILFDNDAPGLKDGEKLAKETGFTNLVLPTFTQGKDVSDYFKAFGKEALSSLIFNLLKS